MSSARARAPSSVVWLDAEREIRRPQTVENANPSGTNSKAEILSLSNKIAGDLSPTVPEVRKSRARSKKRSSPKLQNDEQISVEQIGAFIRGMSAKELKARFPKAWAEHQTLKRKTHGKRWLQLHPGFSTFPDFLRSMGPAPHSKVSVDRINPDNPVYGPDLCRWLDAKGQANNRSTNVYVTWCGERHTLAEWADLSGISYDRLKRRHQRRWTEERMFHDALVLRYRTARAPLVPPPAPAPTPIGSYTFNVGPTPLMLPGGWPEGFPQARQFETGYNHALSKARKKGSPPLSRAAFGAWVVGSQVQKARRQIDAAGLSGYILPIGRELIPADGIAEIDARACACPAIRQYYELMPYQACFLLTHMDECERRYPSSSNPREGARHQWRDQVKRKPCLLPNDVWKFFEEK